MVLQQSDGAYILTALPQSGDTITIHGTRYVFIPADTRVIEIARTKAEMADIITQLTGIPTRIEKKTRHGKA